MPKEKKKELREIVKREMSGVEQWTERRITRRSHQKEARGKRRITSDVPELLGNEENRAR